jgi:hypothetical protein
LLVRRECPLRTIAIDTLQRLADSVTAGLLMKPHLRIRCTVFLFARSMPIKLLARYQRNRPKLPDYFGIYAALFRGSTLSIDGKSLLRWLITFRVCHKSY